MDTNKLIENLASEAKPVKRILPLPARVVLWSLFAIVIIASWIPILGGLRYDLSTVIIKPRFIIESALLLIAAFTATYTTFRLSYPDIKIERNTRNLIILSSLIWAGVNIHILFGCTHETLSRAANAPNLINHCLVDLSTMIILPASLLFYLIWKSSSVRPKWAGYTAMIAATSIGALGMRYLCPVDESAHLLLWHFLPVIGFAGLGIILGRLILKW